MTNNMEKTPVMPIPDGVEPPAFQSFAKVLGRKSDGDGPRETPTFTAAWTYRLASGEEAFYIARYELASRKVYLPVTWCRDNQNQHSWSVKGPSGPRPLFRLDILTDDPGAHVLVVEGEKTAEAASNIIPTGWCVTTSSFGAKSAGKTDWTPLQGRVVKIWRDADAAGQAYAEAVRAEALRAGAAEVWIVDLPAGLSEGWDLADDLPEWLTVDDVQRLILGEPMKEEGTASTDADEPVIGDAEACPTQQDIEPVGGSEDSPSDPSASGPVSPNDTDALEGLSSTVAHEQEAKPGPSRPSFGPFVSDEDGVWIDDPEAKVPGRVWLSAPIEVLAMARDTQGEKWGLLLRWRDRDGMSHQEILPKDLLYVDWRDAIRLLARGGLHMAANNKAMVALITYLSGVDVRNRVRLVDRIGWKSGVYVLPDTTIGGSAHGESFVLAHPTADSKFQTSGSLQDWQEQIAIHAIGNSRLTFTISTAFASGMAPLMGSESGGFNLYGPSSRGKTTLVDVAGSVCGGPAYRETWRATGAGLEAIARAHNHALLVLDEQGMVLSSEAAEIAYLLASGLSKLRATKGMEIGERLRWMLQMLSTGEVTLADKVREAGKIPRVGQDVRVIDIYAIPDGADQVFECWPGFQNSGALAKHLAAASQEYYGTAFRAFLRELAQADSDLLNRVRLGIRNWVAKQVPVGADTQIERVADRFGLVAMAGEVAIRFGVVPWERGAAYWASEQCFKSWLVHRGNTDGGEVQQGIRALVDFIDLHGSSRFADIRDPLARVNNRAGYLRMHDDGSVDYLLTPAGWAEVCAGKDAPAIARACEAAGLLTTSFEGAQKRYATNVKIAGGTERLYVISASGLAAWRCK